MLKVQTVEKTGRTVDEAVKSALAELKIDERDALIDVLDEPVKGLFGILGGRPARVKVSLKPSPSRQLKMMLAELLSFMDLSAEVKIIEKEGTIMINLEGDDLGVLIGRRGETLDALEYLLNLCVNKKQEQRLRVVLDAEGYRKRREATLFKLAQRLAEKAINKGRSVVLEPMTPSERRIIHLALQGREDIYTFSEGAEPYRKIIISPKRHHSGNALGKRDRI